MITSHLSVGLTEPESMTTAELRMPEASRTAASNLRGPFRLSSPGDERALARLAMLDSSTPPAEPVLLARVDGQLLAALALSDGSIVADPFHATADLIDLLRARARQLDGNRPAEAPQALTLVGSAADRRRLLTRMRRNR
jgi:hypothetical protein